MRNPDAPRIVHPVAWVPSAYLAEGIPFALVIWVAGTMLKDLGHRDGEITLMTASIGLAWSLKPLWAAALDMWKTKKFFVIAMQYSMAGLLVIGALVLRWNPAAPTSGESYLPVLIGLLWLIAFCSATQDICIDGIYITALDRKRQAAFVGVQGMAWNGGRIFATAVVVWLAGMFQDRLGLSARHAWSNALLAAAGSLLCLAIYHNVVLPLGTLAVRPESLRAAAATFVDTLRDFARKPKLWGMLVFVFLYRSGEGFLLVEAPLFLQASVEQGGVGLSLQDKSLIDGTISTAVSVLGGLAGGAVTARFGLRRSLFWLALSMNVPHLCFVYLSQHVSAAQPLSFATVATWVTIEKFGYSFGFVANMLYMMQQIAPGKYPTTHYAFCTALMNLVLVPTQMASGPLAERLGYPSFFLFVLVASVPSLLAAWFAPFPRLEKPVAMP